jgi:hypothetical protein
LFCRNIRETLASKGLMLLEWLKKPRFYTIKMNKFVGIDISKETFDIYFEQEGKGQCQ